MKRKNLDRERARVAAAVAVFFKTCVKCHYERNTFYSKITDIENCLHRVVHKLESHFYMRPSVVTSSVNKEHYLPRMHLHGRLG